MFKKVILFFKNILIDVIEIPLDIILMPLALVFSIIKRINNKSIQIDRHLNNFRLKGRKRK